MAFSNTQTIVEYEINGKMVKDLKVVFKHMKDSGLTKFNGLVTNDEFNDTNIYETPRDDEFIGIPSLDIYNLSNPNDLAFDSDNFNSSSGVTGGSGKESEYIGSRI